MRPLLYTETSLDSPTEDVRDMGHSNLTMKNLKSQAGMDGYLSVGRVYKENEIMGELTPLEREEIIRRRGNLCDRDGRKHPTSDLEIHHIDRNPNNNNPSNLRVLCKPHHDELHSRD